MEDELDELFASISPEISLLQLATELGETPTFDLQLHPSRTNVEFKPAASGELQHFKDKNLNKDTTKSTATVGEPLRSVAKVEERECIYSINLS